MRDRNGRIVLMDFGTGRARELPDDTAVADLAGTPLYMAPELFTGGAASAQTDVYSVGVLLYPPGDRQLSARRRDRSPRCAQGTRESRVRRLRDERSDLPAPFVQHRRARAVAAIPARRYESAGALELALTGLPRDVGRRRRLGARRGAAAPAAGSRRAAGRASLALRRSGLGRRLVAGSPRRRGAAAAGDAAPPMRFLITPPGDERVRELRAVARRPLRRLHRRGPAVGRGRWTASRRRAFADTQGAHDPFWSPDGRFDRLLQAELAVDRRHRAAASRAWLCPAWNAMGGSWGPDGTILFAADLGRAIYACRPTAASARRSGCRASTAPTCAGRRSCPRARGFIYSRARAPRRAAHDPWPARLDGSAATSALLESDVERAGRRRPAALRAPGPAVRAAVRRAHAALSGEPRAGRRSACHRISTTARTTPTSRRRGRACACWPISATRQVDRELRARRSARHETPLIGPGEFRDIAVSPAGDALAYEQLDEVAGTRDIWMLDLARRQTVRITSDPDDDTAPAWSPDGALDLLRLEPRRPLRRSTAAPPTAPAPTRWCIADSQRGRAVRRLARRPAC